MESVSDPQMNNGVTSCIQTPDWDNVFLYFIHCFTEHNGTDWTVQLP